jgi:hypothetical protein
MSDSYSSLAVPLNGTKQTLILSSYKYANNKFCATLKYTYRTARLNTPGGRDIIIIIIIYCDE